MISNAGIMAHGYEKSAIEEADEARLRRLDKLVHLLDTAILIPGMHRRVGLDGG